MFSSLSEIKGLKGEMNLDFGKISEDIRKQQEMIIKAGEKAYREKREAIAREERSIELLEKILNSQSQRVSKQQALEILSDLINSTKDLYGKGRESAQFIKWNSSVEAAFVRIFDDPQKRIKDLRSISFSPDHVVDVMFGDGEREIMQAFNKGVELTVAMLESFEDEIKKYWIDDVKIALNEDDKKPLSKVFVSHYTGDKEIVGCIIELLESMGFANEKIFCSSFPPYDIPLGENPMEYIKNEFNNDVLALFILTKTFFERPVCMCEMGAAWVKAGKSIPIIIPPLGYEDIKGVIKEKQGFKINDEEKLNSFYSMLKKTFRLAELDINVWQRKRNNFITSVNNLINSDATLQFDYNYSEQSYKVKGLVTNIEKTHRKNENGKQIYIFTLNNEKRINVYASGDVSNIVPEETIIEATPYKANDNVDFEKYVKKIK